MEGPSNGEGMSGGPKTPQQAAAQRRLQQTQAQVDEVVGIMRMNVEKVIERDQKLSELDDRADALQQGASQFEQQAGKLKRKFWWKNLKMMIIMGIIGLIIIIIIGVSIFGGSGSSSSGGDSGHENAVTSTPAVASSEKTPGSAASYEYKVDYAAAELNVLSIVFEDSDHNTTGESSESKNITSKEHHKFKSTTITTPLVLEEKIEVENSDERETGGFPGSMTVLHPPNRKSGRNG